MKQIFSVKLNNDQNDDSSKCFHFAHKNNFHHFQEIFLENFASFEHLSIETTSESAPVINYKFICIFFLS